MIILPLVFPVVGFVFWWAVLYHYSQMPIDKISQAAVYGVLCFDLLITIGSHALSIYFLSSASPRFGRTWFVVVLILLLFVAGECVVRWSSVGFGEPIYRMVADAMLSPLVYIFLPVIGLASGSVLFLFRRVRR